MDNHPFEQILARLHAAQTELNAEIDRLLAANRERFRYTLERGRVVFDQGVHYLQRQRRTGVWHYLRTAPLGYLLSAPLIYSLILPLALLDAWITLYQHVCFRVYRIPRVRRRDYFVIDRHRLGYLNAIEQLNCAYCGYANQLLEYSREVAARTEQFWCPIKHARRTPDPHVRSRRFIDYGDADAYPPGLRARRDALRDDSGDAENSPGT
ncbi:MAG: hypothetical protein PVH47_08330 [Thiohalocapsa sp.]|jgi:hypothetical protein